MREAGSGDRLPISLGLARHMVDTDRGVGVGASRPSISMIVPTRDSSSGVRRLLNSVPNDEYSMLQVVLNDDPRSRDRIEEIAEEFRVRGMDIVVARTNTAMAVGRREGARLAVGEILLHLDSDMTVSPQLLSELREMFGANADAAVVPEIGVGQGFWARCKALEKRCAQGDVRLESLRAVRASVYWGVGGHDRELVWGEDKDLDLRVRRTGAQVLRTAGWVVHFESALSPLVAAKKKGQYAATAGLFAAKHPHAFRSQRSPIRIARLLGRAVLDQSGEVWLVPGLLLVKSCEYLAVGVVLARRRAARFRRTLRVSLVSKRWR